jgi:hypothetical protein
MENLFMLLLLISLFLLVIGFFSPKTSLFWYKKERTRKMSLLLYGLSTIIFFTLFGITAPSLKDEQSKLNSLTSEKEGNSSTPEMSQLQKDSIAKIKQQEIAVRKSSTFNPDEIVAGYSKNEVAADNIFKDKNFYVVGYVDRVGKNVEGDTYVIFKTGDMIRKVQCFVEDQDALAKLSPGQKITVYGVGGGLMMNVLVQNCKIVDNLPN